MLEYGKIFVVVAVLSIILAGIFVYLFLMDRKIGKLEKEIKAESTQKEK
jgi:CcmD family protein